MSAHQPVRLARRVMMAVALSMVVATLVAPVAHGVSVRRTWTAHVGANGTATLAGYWTGLGTIRLKLGDLRPSTTYPVIAFRGACAKPTLITNLPKATTDATGSVSHVWAISQRVMDRIWGAGRTAAFSIRIGSGAQARCGSFTFPVATRVAIPGLNVDLPVVKPQAGYPLCNVAMYIQELSQPREAGVTLLYAHAREGMFLPLLDRSRRSNGAALVGSTVKVWTSNDLVYTYRITRVRRHVTSLDGVFDIGPEQLWIQTSEGPRGTVAKLIIVAKRVGVEAASHASAHPAAHPVVCR